MTLLKEGGISQNRTQPERDLSGTLIEADRSHVGYRILALPQDKVRGIIFDLDGTLYQNELYRRDIAQKEAEAVATAVGWPVTEAPTELAQQRQALGRRLGRPARLTETVFELGLTRQWWDTTREAIYRPEEFITPDQTVISSLQRLIDSHRVAIATNSPSGVAHRILDLLGADECLRRRMLIVGPDTLGVSKPDPEFFLELARRLDVSPEQCLSIGDDEQNDAHPAIEAGMGAIIISKTSHIDDVLGKTLHEQEYEPFNLEQFARDQFRPGEITIVGLTGRAGAGKTTTAKNLTETYEMMGIPAAPLGLDAFFKLSSKERKAWLEKGKLLGEHEYWRRADQMQWWDFDRANEALTTLRAGRSLHLQGIYNRADKGELTGELRIDPDPQGMVIVLEGVATAHLKQAGDHFLYVNAHPKVRRERLLGRDQHRAGDTAYERFQITQSFENKYFPQHMTNIDTVVENSNGALLKAPAVPHL